MGETETEGYWKPRHPLKGPTHRLSLTDTHPGLWQRDSDSVEVGSSRDIGEKLSCVASEQGLKWQLPLSLC